MCVYVCMNFMQWSTFCCSSSKVDEANSVSFINQTPIFGDKSAV